MQPVRLYILSGRPFEETLKNTQWRKVKPMQPVRLFILTGRPFEETLKKTLRGKVEFMTSYFPSRYLSFILSVADWPTNQRKNIDVIELSRESIQTLEKKDDDKIPIHFPTQLLHTKKG